MVGHINKGKIYGKGARTLTRATPTHLGDFLS
jgi:hypothetical protein